MKTVNEKSDCFTDGVLGVREQNGKPDCFIVRFFSVSKQNVKAHLYGQFKSIALGKYCFNSFSHNFWWVLLIHTCCTGEMLSLIF